MALSSVQHNQTGKTAAEKERGWRHRVGDRLTGDIIDVGQQQGSVIIGDTGQQSGIEAARAQLVRWRIAHQGPAVYGPKRIGARMIGDGTETCRHALYLTAVKEERKLALIKNVSHMVPLIRRYRLRQPLAGTIGPGTGFDLALIDENIQSVDATTFFVEHLQWSRVGGIEPERT